MTTIPTRDILWTSPYTDPDRASYGEQPAAKELVLRVAATPKGSGTLITRRTSVSQIVEAERTGRSLHLLTSATGWVADSNVTVTTAAQQPTGYSGNSLAVQGTGGSSTDRGARYTFSTALDLSVFGGGALIRVHRRITSVTNLTRAVLRFEFATTSDWAEYELAPSGATINTWSEIVVGKGNPRATNGTVDWANVTAIRLFLDVSGTYTGDLQVRDLRMGTVETAKGTPDGAFAWETSIDARARYRDNADAKASTTLAAASSAGATNVKVASVSNLAVGDELTIATAGLVETRTITTVGTSGAGGTGVTVSEAYTFAHGSGDTVEVRYWGPWSSWLTVKASQPPTVAADTPADAATVTDPTPTLAHTYSSPASKAQASRTYRIYERVGGIDQLIRETTVAGTGLTDTLPAFLVETGKTYAWEKVAYDSDGLSGTTDRRTFTTDFTAPDRATGPAPSGAWSLELADDVVAADTALPYTHPFVAWVKARAVSFWRMNEPSGTTMTDLLGVKDGTFSGGTVGAAAVLPGDADARSFDLPGGDSANALVANDAAYDFLGGTTAFTVGILLDIVTFTSPDYGFLYVGGSGGVVLLLHHNGSSYARRTDSGGSFDDATFNTSITGRHLWVVTYDGASLAVYRDGELATGGTNPVASTRSVATASKILRFAGNAGTTSIDGRAAEAFVVDAALTADEVAELAALVTDDPGVAIGDLMRIDTGATSEIRQAEAIGTAGAAGTGITVAALRSGHSAGATIEERSEVVATSDPEAGTVILEWEASTDPDLHHYRVFWQDARGDWIRIDEGPAEVDDGRTPLTIATLAVARARIGDNAFQVTVHNGAQESDEAQVSATLGGPPAGGSWMLVDELDGRYTTPLRIMEAPRLRESMIERFTPPGRGSTIHLSWGIHARRVSARVRIRPSTEGDLALLLDQLQDAGAGVWLKAPAGWLWDPIWVRVTGSTDVPGTGGMMELAVEFEEAER